MTVSGEDSARIKNWADFVRGRKFDAPFVKNYRNFCLLSGLNVPRGGVIHLGGHTGEELPFYLCYGFQRILTVEPLPDVFERLEQRAQLLMESAQTVGQFYGHATAPQIKCVNCAISDAPGRIPFYVAKATHWSSTEPLQKEEWGKHLFRGPWYQRMLGRWLLRSRLRSQQIEVEAQTLDGVLASLDGDWGTADYQYLRMNIQGAELRALRGASEFLRRVQFIDFDQTIAPRYGGTGTASLAEYDAILTPLGFRLVSSTGGAIDARRIYRRDPQT